MLQNPGLRRWTPCRDVEPGLRPRAERVSGWLGTRPPRVCSPQPGRAGWLRAEYPAEPQQIVRRSHQIASQLRAGHAAEPCLPQAPGGFDPPDDLLDPFTEALTEGVARGSCGASVGVPGEGFLDQPGPVRPWAPPAGHVVSPNRSRPSGRLSGVTNLVTSEGTRWPSVPERESCRVVSGPPNGGGGGRAGSHAAKAIILAGKRERRRQGPRSPKGRGRVPRHCREGVG
jgi:hypothetical protein